MKITLKITMKIAVFNDTKVQFATSQKHLRLILDSKLDFNEHIDNKINKINKQNYRYNEKTFFNGRRYQELGLESSVNDHRLFLFHKITQALLVSYLQTYHKAVCERAYLTRLTTQNKTKNVRELSCMSHYVSFCSFL